MATNKDQAERWALRTAKEDFPPADGYYNHAVCVDETNTLLDIRVKEDADSIRYSRCSCGTLLHYENSYWPTLDYEDFRENGIDEKYFNSLPAIVVSTSDAARLKESVEHFFCAEKGSIEMRPVKNYYEFWKGEKNTRVIGMNVGGIFKASWSSIHNHALFDLIAHRPGM